MTESDGQSSLPLPPPPNTPWHQLPSGLRTALARGLDAMDDYEFEQLVAEGFKSKGYSVRTTPRGADDGIDVFLSDPKRDNELSVVQCKHWKRQVGVVELREFYGAMVHFKAARGYYVCSSGITDSGRKFVQGKPITIVAPTELMGEYLRALILQRAAEILLQERKRLATSDKHNPKAPDIGSSDVQDAKKAERHIIIADNW